MSAERDSIVIIGAGPTGLGAAYRLSEIGVDDFLILEAGRRPGGLACSYVDANGFTWDVGGHVGFSHYAYYDHVLDRALGDQWLWHERESWVWIDNRFVPYPFQNNIHRLDPIHRDQALAGLDAVVAAAPNADATRTFAAWIRASFGDGLAELFMEPYNRKVWGYPLDELGSQWVGERVALPDLARIRRNIATGTDDVSWGPNRRFRFPMRGGTGAIWEAVAGLLPCERFIYGDAVAAVDLDAHTVTTASGRQVRFSSLLSTMPLDEFVRLAQPLPETVRCAAAQLRFSSVHVLGIGLAGPRPESLETKCWMYFPEAHSPYYRVTVFSNYSPHHVPAGTGCWSLMAEVCESPAKPVDATTLVDATVRAMRADRLIPPQTEVVDIWHHRAAHGYPTPFLGRDDVLSRIHPALEARQVSSRGRFGGWKYEVSNQDHSFMQGVEWADRVRSGRPEVTYHDPNRANSGEFLASAR